jgi:hypothetical protein
VRRAKTVAARLDAIDHRLRSIANGLALMSVGIGYSFGSVLDALDGKKKPKPKGRKKAT